MVTVCVRARSRLCVWVCGGGGVRKEVAARVRRRGGIRRGHGRTPPVPRVPPPRWQRPGRPGGGCGGCAVRGQDSGVGDSNGGDGTAVAGKGWTGLRISYALPDLGLGSALAPGPSRRRGSGKRRHRRCADGMGECVQVATDSKAAAVPVVGTWPARYQEEAAATAAAVLSGCATVREWVCSGKRHRR